MVPVNFASRLVNRPQLLHRLSRNLSTTGELFGGCGCRQSREDCPPQKCDTKVTRTRRKCKQMEHFQSGHHQHQDGKLPEFCSKTALTEFSWKMQELQKNWESIAAQMEKDCEARGFKKEKDHKQKSPCAVKPPVKEEEHGKSIGSLLVVLGALALAAAIGYYLYMESQKGKEDEDKKDENPDGKPDDKKDDKKDPKKDDKKP